MKQILVVDDDKINRLVARRFLEKSGYEIQEAESGMEALEQLKSGHEADPAAILMDVQMPEMDGIETTRQVRAMGGRFADIPIIALSAYSDEDIESAGRKAGIDAFMRKPIDFSSLIGTIEAHT